MSIEYTEKIRQYTHMHLNEGANDHNMSKTRINLSIYERSNMKNFDPNIAFNGLPELPPAVDIETKPILKKCIEAKAALAELKTAGKLIPNQRLLINIIPLLEAKDSSEIENIVTTTDSLFKYAASQNTDKADHATKEALRYRTALREGFEAIETKPLSTATAIQICSVIKNIDAEIRKVPGTQLANHNTLEVIYTPPAGESILRQKLTNWEKFLHEDDDIDPLIKMAIGHYQFEAIHPFTDGNGRTGRVLNILYLIEKKLLYQPILYLSKYILENKSDYYRLLLKVTKENAWEEWILFKLQGILETSQWTIKKIEAIRSLSDHTQDYIKTNLNKIYSRELVDIIFTQPYCRISNLTDANIGKRDTASNYLKQLSEQGILEQIKIGREKLFIHKKLLDLLQNDEHKYAEYK